MSFSIASKVKSILPGAAFAAVLTGAAFLVGPEPAQAISPAYTTTSSTGGFYTQNPASFGFFFDTDRDVTIDALGFSSQPGWPTGTSSYQVALWSFVNGGNAIGDYTLIDQVTFTPGTPYEFKDGYFWQDIPLVTLSNSTSGDPSGLNGFVIGVIGDFTNATGNVQYEGGVASFLPGIVGNVNGFNGGPATDSFWPVPAYFPTPVQGSTAYFNGNLSFAPVPSPLPMLGAAAGFSWTRRMRQRILLSR